MLYFCKGKPFINGQDEMKGEINKIQEKVKKEIDKSPR